MAGLSVHEAVYAELRENLSAYLRADTLPEGGVPGPEEAAFLHPDAAPDEGPACVVGVIDDAIPLAHPRFTVRAGPGAPARSRIASIWMMGAAAGGGGVAFGREWRGTEIDGLLARHAATGAGIDEEALYRSAGVWRAARGPLHAGGRRAAHGAAVADLAAGTDPADPGARARPVIAACLPPEVTRDTSGTFAPWFVLLGTLHILDRARRLAEALGRPPLPVAINLSYGLTAGSKDGGGLVEGFQRIVAEEGVEGVGAVRFVLPMGNHRLGRLRARLPEGGGTLAWRAPPDDATPSFVELHGPPAEAAPGPLGFALTPPGGAPWRAELPHGTAAELTLRGRHLARAYCGLTRAPDGRLREVLTIAIPATDEDAEPRGSAGDWSLSVTRGPFDAYVQRDDAVPGFGGGARQVRFAAAGPQGGSVLREGTVNAWATGDPPWQVAASGALPERPGGPPWARGAPPAGGEAPGPLAPYSAFPVGVHGEDDPVLMAGARAVTDRSPARRGVPAAGAFAGTRLRVSGTSAAAPQVTRALADALARGRAPSGPIRPPAPAERRGY